MRGRRRVSRRQRQAENQFVENPMYPDMPSSAMAVNGGQRRRGKSGIDILKTILSWTFQILVVILFAYVIVYFFGQSRTNIGQSMDVTLQGGDTVLLNVFAYQIGTPERGDIISFKPNGSSTSHSSIKRVIGLPGETIQIKEGMIYIDGEVFLEQKSYPVMTNPGMASEEITLGSKEYFVLGDNRNNSEDSRFADVGLVSSDYIEGKVWFVLSPSEHRGLIRD
ncbi:MAG: signal peptidase I [Lachnospiraceae bacterium]|nr:signal peptidase I [Lachnospiraceae bacterium]